jgi:hypothetical protein
MIDLSMKLREKWLMPGIEEEQKKRNKLDLHSFKKKNSKRKI